MKWLFFLVVLLTGCTRPQSATKVLLDAGYSQIEITGWRPFACAQNDDEFATGFHALGPTGRKVSGVVCQGLIFKASTIRLD